MSKVGKDDVLVGITQAISETGLPKNCIYKLADGDKITSFKEEGKIRTFVLSSLKKFMKDPANKAWIKNVLDAAQKRKDNKANKKAAPKQLLLTDIKVVTDTQADKSEWLSADQIMTEFGLSYETVYKMIDKGLLIFTPHGNGKKEKLITRASLEKAFMIAHAILPAIMSGLTLEVELLLRQRAETIAIQLELQSEQLIAQAKQVRQIASIKEAVLTNV